MVKRSLKDLDFSIVYNVYMMFYLIGGVLFIVEDFFMLVGILWKLLELEYVKSFLIIRLDF